uniref:BTB domain-containing protein n=1 Tax=Strigamia maritima TaxID=126957 RepID=T1J0N0_STRMM
MFGVGDHQQENSNFPGTSQESKDCAANEKTEVCIEGHKLCDKDHELQIDNSATVLEKIASLYAERLLSDITLIVGGRQFPAHRLILCASSDVFQVMLMNPNWTESQETTVNLQEDPACISTFGDFLKYLYTGKIHINHYTVLPLLTLADKYNVRDLINLCIDYMCQHIVSAAACNQLISWLQYTLNCGHDRVGQDCHNFIKWNFQMVTDTEDLISLETDVLISFLTECDLVIHDEFALYSCVAKWLAAQEQKLKLREDTSNIEEQFKALVTEVMLYIRFPMMSPRQLAELLLYPLTIRFKEFFVEKMAVAMAFHSGQKDRVDLAVKTFTYKLFKPRLYTIETWSASLTVENYLNFQCYGIRTLVFSSPASSSEVFSDKVFDWSVDVYPKGVWFKKFQLIVWQGTLEMPETILRTVRLSVMSKDNDTARVNVGILISGMQDGVEHVKTVVQKRFVFTESEQMLNIDNLIPFDELNDIRNKSPYLVGAFCNTLKLQIVITPMNMLEL